MNDQSFVKFNKIRTLGGMISSTVQFLGREGKPLLLTIIKAAIIPILIAICAVIYFSFSVAEVYEETVYYETILDLDFSGLWLPLFAYFFSYLIAQALIASSTLSYIKSYNSNRGIVNFEEVTSLIKEKFGSFVGLLFLNGLIIGFGALLCVIPGIYFGVVLSISTSLVIFQSKGVTESINDSFGFIKNNWWDTFGILIVVHIIIWIISFILELPIGIYEEAYEGSNILTDTVYILLLVFSNLIAFFFYVISIIITAFIYFDIKEQYDPSSDTDVIDEIGTE
ncbi:MAG: hypothetical protein JXR05_14805 [Flavobacteriaceae bacterium]